MDGFSEKLQAIISNPEAISAIGEVAKKLMNENSAKPAEDNYALQSGGAADEIEKLKKIPEVSMAIEHYKKYKNERIQLLLAIKPFLGEERKEKADAVISFLRILELLDSAGGMF